MAWAVNKYGYINAKLRAQLSKRVGEEQFQHMISAGSIAEALQVLEGTEYGSAFGVYHETGDMKMVERELVRDEIEALAKLRSAVDEEIIGIIDAFLERYEIETLKDALRYWFDRSVRKRGVEDKVLYMLRGPIVHDIDFSAVVYAGDVNDVSEQLAGTPYQNIMQEHLPAALETGSLFEAECGLENLYFQRLTKKIDKLTGKDREIAEHIIGIQVDMENITRLSRYARFFKERGGGDTGMFIPGGKNVGLEELRAASAAKSPRDFVQTTITQYYNAPRLFEGAGKERDDSFFVLLLSVLQDIFITEVTKLLRGYPFTIGIVLAYCFIKQHEMRKIMSVLNAKYYGIDEGRMGELI